jgi:hypothetical protein
MKPEYVLEEQRKTRRFRVKEQTSFVINFNWPDKGMLVDIGKGGFAFHYLSELPWPDDVGHGCLIFGEHDSCLAHVPVEVVADRIIHCGQGNTMIVRRRSIKFGVLNEQQQFLLECFIWINGGAQC